jgi:hypothetical protein
MTQPPEDPLRKNPDDAQGGYPPPGAYPPPQGSYPPPQGSYPPPSDGGYPPPPGSYPPPPGSYPPPQTGGYQSPHGHPGGGLAPVAPELTVGSALSYGWSKFSANVGPWILVSLLAVAASIVVNLVFGGFGENNSVGLALVGAIVSFVINVLFQAAYIRGALTELDGGRPRVGDFFRFSNFGTILVLAIVIGLLVGIGLVLLIIPGIVLAYLTYFALTFAIDRDRSLGAALSESFSLTRHNVGKLLPLAVVCFLLNIVGFVLCLVGLLVTIPVTLIAGTYAYRVLTGGVVTTPGNPAV